MPSKPLTDLSLFAAARLHGRAIGLSVKIYGIYGAKTAFCGSGNQHGLRMLWRRLKDKITRPCRSPVNYELGVCFLDSRMKTD